MDAKRFVLCACFILQAAAAPPKMVFQVLVDDLGMNPLPFRRMCYVFSPYECGQHDEDFGLPRFCAQAGGTWAFIGSPASSRHPLLT